MNRITALVLAALILLFSVVVFWTPNPAKDNIIHAEKSLYRDIIVYEDGDLRCMAFGRRARGRQSCILLSDRDRLVFGYTRMMMGALYLNPSPERVLIVGLGGGTLPGALQKMLPAAQIDIVEVDPAVVRVARTYFQFAPGPTTRIVEQDGRVFVKRMLRKGVKYDLVMLDAFDHEYIPEHLLTREFLGEIRKILSQEGALAANTFTSSRLYDHESATYYGVFGDFYNLKMENRIILWRPGGLPETDELEKTADLLEGKLRMFGTGKDSLLSLFRIDHDWPPETRVLTDQYSPSNLLNSS